MNFIIPDVIEPIESDLCIGDVILRLLYELKPSLHGDLFSVTEPLMYHGLATMKTCYAENYVTIVTDEESKQTNALKEWW